MTKVERARKGGSSRSEAKKASSSRNLALARARKKELAAESYPVRWLLKIFNRDYREPAPGSPRAIRESNAFKEAVAALQNRSTTQGLPVHGSTCPGQTLPSEESVEKQ